MTKCWELEDEIPLDWISILSPNEFHWRLLLSFLRREYRLYTIYPPKNMIFNAFRLCPWDHLKVVIIGQDPYPSSDAMGLSFSSKNPKIPMSLKIIIKELQSEIPFLSPQPIIDPSIGGDLTSWAKQGILLLNRTLTVRKGEPLSHYGKGWEIITSSIIRKISKKKEGIVFILWGSKAQELEENIDKGRNHLIIKGAHPIPSRKKILFLGSKPFTKINSHLQKHSIETLDFSIVPSSDKSTSTH